MHRYTEEFARHGIVAGQVLLTVDDVTRRSHYRNAYRTFAKLLELGVLPIVNENDTVATTEIRFGDNDRLAALVAHLVHADLLVLLSDVDGLYDGDPAAGSRARSPRWRSDDDLGRRRSAAPARAGRRHRRHAAPSSRRPGSPPAPGSRSCSPPRTTRVTALAGEPVGTLFHADRPASPDPAAVAGPRDRAEGRGSLLDEGAVRAVTERRASLLPAGITGVDRRVRRPATRSTWSGPTARRWPAGWSTTTPTSSRPAGPRRPATARASSGAAYEREVVHRDDLVLLPRH